MFGGGMADGLLTSALNWTDQQKRILYARLGLLMNNPQEFAAQLGSEARQRAGVGLFGEPKTAQEMASGAWINSPYGQQAMQAGSGFAGTVSPIVKSGNPIQSAVVLIGDKIFTGRTHSDALQRAIYEGAVRKEGGKLIFPKNAEINSDLFMTHDGRIIDRFDASKLFDIGASETAIKEGLMQNKPASSMSVDYYMQEAKKIKNK